MAIELFDGISPKEIDALASCKEGFGNGIITSDDSPISIDAMVSVQNCKLMFVSSVKIGTIVGLLETEDTRLSLSQRRQRKVDVKRIPVMAEYLHNNPWTYSAITVALSGIFSFMPIVGTENRISRQGILRIPRGYKSRTVIIDGQHRFLSLRAVLGLEPDYTRYSLPYEKQQSLANENIAVIFYVFKDDNDGIAWSQQYFHDLNCLGVSTSLSLGIKFDKRAPLNRLTVRIAERAIPFMGRIEFEERQCTGKNKNIFTLSALKTANKYLLEDVSEDNLAEKYDICLKYWNVVGEQFPEWKEMNGHEIRDNYIHGHGVILSALGLTGRQIINEYYDDLEQILTRLKTIDWLRWKSNNIQTDNNRDRIGNPFWNGFALSGSTVQNTTTTVRMTSIMLRKHLGLRIKREEEKEYRQTRSEISL